MTTVTRTEIAHHIGDAFEESAVPLGELIEYARAAQARPEVLAVLNRLPERSYAAMRDLWVHLEDVPVEKSA